jgi:hypothetical protein
VNTCRFCGRYNEPLIKYGVRHYAHAACAFEKLGAAFLDRINPSRLGELPYFELEKRGLLKEVERRMKEAP